MEGSRVAAKLWHIGEYEEMIWYVGVGSDPSREPLTISLRFTVRTRGRDGTSVKKTGIGMGGTSDFTVGTVYC